MSKKPLDPAPYADLTPDRMLDALVARKRALKLAASKAAALQKAQV